MKLLSRLRIMAIVLIGIIALAMWRGASMNYSSDAARAGCLTSECYETTPVFTKINNHFEAE